MNTYKVTLTKEERDELIEITRTGKHAAKENHSCANSFKC